MIAGREALSALLKCVRLQQAVVIDHVTSIGALLEYSETRDPEFRAYLKWYQQSNRAASDLIGRFAQMNQVIGEVIQRLESGEEIGF